MYSYLEESERRELARRYLDSAESWLRRIVHHQLAATYGDNYFADVETSVVPKRIRHDAQIRRAKEPDRFPRWIDATTFGQLTTLLLHPALFGAHFREPLAVAYPDGQVEARTFLDRLEKLRNKLAHGSTCSVRELEQAVCYSNDLVDSLRGFYVSQNRQRVFNVPMITKFVDSLGNELHPPLDRDDHVVFSPKHHGGYRDLEVGQTLDIEVEVDQTFDPSGYVILWDQSINRIGTGHKLTLPITVKHVGEDLHIECRVRSNKEWHRLGMDDDRLLVVYRVLPPA